MKVLRLIRLTAVVLALLVPSQAFPDDLGAARTTLLEGDVQIFTGDSGEWFPASINMPLKEGDRLWVPEGGRVELHIRGGAYVRLDELSSMDILVLEDDSVQFYLEEGLLYGSNLRNGFANIRVDTPIVSVSIYDNSATVIDVDASGATEVSVVKGYAYAEGRSGRTRVTAGTSLYFDEDAGEVLSLIERPDEWERWNRLRDDRLLRPRESVRYLPEELHEYAYDFDGHGSWRYVKAYGYVWVPRVSISVGWAPYRHGKWVWVRGDYVWVSYESWGWVPYHYGRWAYAAHIGWFWVPPRHRAVFWGPGYVSWVYTPTYVAWVPLAPGEVYYGYGYYGRDSVNIFFINISKTVVKHVHKNVYVKGAVTIIHKDTFLRGRKVRVDVKHNPFLKERHTVGPPHIRPERFTRAPSAKKIRKGKLPPERVLRAEPGKIRREHRPVRTRESSVSRPDVPGRKMHLRKPDAPAKRIPRKGPARLREQKAGPQEQMRPRRPELGERERWRQEGSAGNERFASRTRAPRAVSSSRTDSRRADIAARPPLKRKARQRPDTTTTLRQGRPGKGASGALADRDTRRSARPPKPALAGKALDSRKRPDRGMQAAAPKDGPPESRGKWNAEGNNRPFDFTRRPK